MSASRKEPNRNSAVLTVAQFADRFQVTRQHVLNAIEAGQLAAINVGTRKLRYWRIPIDEVERYQARKSSLRSEGSK
jgi:excisionase family DNA binding protein